MASKGRCKAKAKSSETSADMECFAYEVFALTAERFRIPEICIPRRIGVKKNVYKYFDLVQVISRGFLRTQIENRNVWKSSFMACSESSGLNSFKEVENLLLNILKNPPPNLFDCIIFEVDYSLALINEFVQFQHAGGHNLYLNELAKLWSRYLSRHKRMELKNAGGLDNLCTIYNSSNLQVLDGFYDEFILKFCLPYGENANIADIVREESLKYIKNISKKLSGRQKFESIHVMESTFKAIVPVVIHKLQVQLPPIEKPKERDDSSGCDIPENPGLGIPQHEELLRHVGVTVASDAAASSDLPGLSHQDETKGRRKASGPESRRQRKASSRASLEKEFEQMTLGSSGPSHLSEKK